MVNRILYVESGYSGSDYEVNRCNQESVIALLRQKFPGCVLAEPYVISWNTLGVLESNRRAQTPFKAMITPVPRNYMHARSASHLAGKGDMKGFYAASYNESLDILHIAKRANPDLLIVAYTGADKVDFVDEVFKERGVDELVRKTRHPEEDATRLIQILDSNFALRKD